LSLISICFGTNNISFLLTSVSAQLEDNFLTYDNPTYGIRIDYPADWEQGGQGVLERLKTENVTGIAMFSPPDKSVQVILAIEKLKPYMLTKDINDTIADIKKEYPDFKILESKEVMFAGLNGSKIVGEGKFPLERIGERFNLQNQTQELQSVLAAAGIKELTVKLMNVATVKGDKVYSLSYGVPLPEILGDQYSLYLPVVQKMIDSMQITNQTNP
jgi:hypothetical protein